MTITNDTYGTKTNPIPISKLPLHIEILNELVQAAVSLEEFTIPLYMCSMYSLVGTHQITSNNAFYRGVWYPGNAITADPNKWVYDTDTYKLNNKIPVYETQANKDPNRTLFRPSNNITFNLIYKVFIEEMLHLQMAANLAKILMVNPDPCDTTPIGPSFTNPKLVCKDTFKWNCFGSKDKVNTIIPYIVDLKDTTNYKDVKVTLGPLNDNQIRLFLAIEAPEEKAKEELAGHLHKYFPNPEKVVEQYEKYKKCKESEKPEKCEKLPLMGSIGHLYQTLWDFLHLEFDTKEEDNCLLAQVLRQNKKPYYQRELFNQQAPNHPISEYPGFDSTVHGDIAKYVFPKIEKLINAITEQGEGSSVAKPKKPQGYTAVKEEARVSRRALSTNYKTYDDEGKELPISPRVPVRAGFSFVQEKGPDAGQTFSSVAADHDELFGVIKDDLMQRDDFMTWDQWHGHTPTKDGKILTNDWSVDLIKAKDYENNTYSHNLPDPEDIAAAMKRLKHGIARQNETPNTDQAEANYTKMCQVSTGAIWGIIHVLDSYWSAEKGSKTLFPFPAMGGTGDRMGSCWTIFGRVPDLSVPLESPRKHDIINHACQGFKAMDPEVNAAPGANDCAEVAIYHTCKGSNLCKAEGGCGFVHKIGGGSSNCSASVQHVQTFEAPFTCATAKAIFSPPADNACGGQGGCAVPISASQLFPKPKGDGVEFGNMQLHDFERDNVTKHWTSIPIDKIPDTIHDKNKYIKYKNGDPVYNIAWEAFEQVLRHRGVNQENLPKKPESTDIRLAFPPST